MDGVRIAALSEIGSKGGNKTLRIDFKKAQEGICAYREKESFSGNHYHKGKSPSKMPETIALLSGTLRLRAENIKSSERFEQEVSAPACIQISANIWHAIKAESDIVFVEMNSLEEHAADTYYDYETDFAF